MVKIIILILSIGITIPYFKIFGGLSILNLLLISASIFLVFSEKKYNFEVLLLISFNLIFFSLDYIILETTRDSIKRFLWPVITIFGSYAILKNDYDLKNFSKYIAILISLSSVVSIFQSYGSTIFWDIRYIFGMPQEAILVDQFKNNLKVSGLAYYGVQLGYQLSCFYPFFLYTLKKNIFPKHIAWVIGIAFVMASIRLESIATLFTIALTTFWFMWISYNPKKTLKYFMCLFVIMYALYSTDNLNRARNITSDPSALSRVGLALMAKEIIMDNPLGVDSQNLNRLKANQIIKIGLPTYFYTIPFHNSFLNIAVDRGLIVAFLYLLITIYFLIRLFRCRFSTFKKSKDLNLNFFIFLSLLSYFIQSLIHNAGIPNGDFFGWFLISLALIIKQQKSKIY